MKSPEAELPNPGKLLFRCVKTLTKDANKLIFVAVRNLSETVRASVSDHPQTSLLPTPPTLSEQTKKRRKSNRRENKEAGKQPCTTAENTVVISSSISPKAMGSNAVGAMNLSPPRTRTIN